VISVAHFRHWPPRTPRRLKLPRTNVLHNAEVSAARYPDKPFIVLYDSVPNPFRHKSIGESSLS